MEILSLDKTVPFKQLSIKRQQRSPVKGLINYSHLVTACWPHNSYICDKTTCKEKVVSRNDSQESKISIKVRIMGILFRTYMLPHEADDITQHIWRIPVPKTVIPRPHQPGSHGIKTRRHFFSKRYRYLLIKHPMT